MKIVWIAPSFDENDTYTFGTCSALANAVEARGHELIRIDMSKYKNKLSRFFGLQYEFWKAVKQKPDVIFSHLIANASLALEWVNNSFYSIPNFAWYAHGQMPIHLRLAPYSLVYLTSSHIGCKAKGHIVLQQMIDTDKFKPNENSEKKYILFTGRISRSKKLEVLLKAYTKLREEISIPPLKIVGKTTDQKYLRELQSHYKFEYSDGYPYSKIEMLYNQAKLFVSPSETNSFDRTTLEAMACGVPVLACGKSFLDDPKFPDECKFKPGDVEQLATRMKTLLSGEALHQEQYEEIGGYCRTYVENHHDLNTFVDKLLNVFEKAIETKKTGGYTL